MDRSIACLAAWTLVAGLAGTAAAQLAVSKPSRFNCHQRQYALSPTEEDRAVTADLVAALNRGESHEQARFLSFEHLQALKRGEAVLMQIYLVDFLRTPQDSLEVDTGGGPRTFTQGDYTAGITVLQRQSDKPILIRVRGDFHCKGKPWPPR